jgi:hypothetical protein
MSRAIGHFVLWSLFFSPAVKTALPQVQLTIEAPTGHAASRADVVVRDREGKREHRIQVDEAGRAAIETVGDPTLVTVEWNGRLFEREIASRCASCRDQQCRERCAQSDACGGVRIKLR